MQDTTFTDQKTLARYAGITLLGSIVIGIIASMTVAKGIDINLSADVVATAEAMMDANLQLRAKAYVGVLSFAVGMVSSVALYLLLRRYGPLLSTTSLVLSLMGAALALLGSVFAMNAAQIASNSAYTVLSTDAQRLMLTGLQATSDYTAFHLGLIISTAANAGFSYLLFKSKLIPPLISGWGVFASIFVVSMIVMRDFIPALGHSGITIAFMVSNLVALVAIGLYLSIRGVRET